MVKDLYSFEKRILANPVTEYIKLQSRLETINPSFPEFKYIVDYLLKELESKEIHEKFACNKALKSLYDIVSIKAKFLNIKPTNKDGVIYYCPYTVSYPYKNTIAVICSILEFLQVYYDQYGTDVAPLYHFDRYEYLLNLLVENKNLVIIPTNYPLQLEDFIMTRHVPIYFVGVSCKPIFYDGRLQSPLEYFHHDVNHSRRLFFSLSENQISLDNISASNTFLTTKVKPLLEKNYLLKYVLFELFHEYSIPVNSDQINKEMSRRAGDSSPYEVITELGKFLGANNLEIQNNGNVYSGMMNRNLLSNTPHEITYYHQSYATVFSTTFHKLKYGFYNNTNIEYKNMNIEDLVDAFMLVADLFDFKIHRNDITQKMIDVKRVELYTTEFEDRTNFVK